MNYSDLNLQAAKTQGVSYMKMAKGAIIGTAVSLFSTVILLVVFALIINAVFGDPDGVLHIFTVIGASLGAITGGYRASKINGSNGLFTGFTTGICTSIIIFIVMLFASEPASVSVETNVTFRLVLILCNIFFACTGGIFAVNSHKNKKTVGYSFRKK